MNENEKESKLKPEMTLPKDQKFLTDPQTTKEKNKSRIYQKTPNSTNNSTSKTNHKNSYIASKTGETTSTTQPCLGSSTGGVYNKHLLNDYSPKPTTKEFSPFVFNHGEDYERNTETYETKYLYNSYNDYYQNDKFLNTPSNSCFMDTDSGCSNLNRKNIRKNDESSRSNEPHILSEIFPAPFHSTDTFPKGTL